ncbi:MAG: hypothetical protein ACXWI8_13585 [Burkholderiales bacterium]
MKGTAGQVLFYVPCLFDIADGRTGLEVGERVKVITPHGCPPPNAMRHCFVGDPETGDFIGLVCASSLHTREEYAAWLREKIAEKEQPGVL